MHGMHGSDYCDHQPRKGRQEAPLTPEEPDLKPLPDLLRPGLTLVFVGINPGIRSALTGRYFAHPRNRFWPAANAAGIFDPPLDPETAVQALDQGIGFTDIVKRPSPGVADLRPEEFRTGALVLARKLLEAAPKVICFNGMVSGQNFYRHAPDAAVSPEGLDRRAKVAFGLQPWKIGHATVFIVPSPSPANAAVSLQSLTGYYRDVADMRNSLARTAGN